MIPGPEHHERDVADQDQNKPWPFRGRPKPDELLSSWLLRAANAMEMKPFALGHLTWRARPPPLARDMDNLADDRILAVIAAATVTPMSVCKQTTLSSYEGYLFEAHQPKGRTAWIMPLGVRGRLRNQPGLQFCPHCLSESPYYRRLWRVSWSTVCVIHRMRLLDRCSRCDAALAPYRSVDGFSCFQCGLPLCQAEQRPATPRMVRFQSAQEVVLTQGWGTLGPYHFPYSIQYFQTVRHVARALSLGQRSHTFCSMTAQAWGGEPTPFTFGNLHDLDSLSVDDRYRLYDLVSRLLDDWPERFIETATSSRLWKSWALRDDPNPPFTYTSLVSARLATPAYSPTLDEVRSVADYLSRAKPGFTKRDIINLVGDSVHIHAIFAQERRRRRKALMAAIRRASLKVDDGLL